MKGIGKAVKKAFKAVTKSKLGRALLVGATIYFGGAALGMWNTPFAAVNGAFVKGGAAAAGSSGTAAAGSVAAPSASMTANSIAAGSTGAGTAAGAGTAVGTTAGTTTALSTMPTGIPVMDVVGKASVASGGASQFAAPALAGTGTAAAAAPAFNPSVDIPSFSTPQPPDLATQVRQGVNQAANKPQGIISRAMSGAGSVAKWATTTIPGAMTVSGLASALGADEIDIMREQQRLQREEDERERKRRLENLQVGDLELGFTPSGQPLRYMTSGMPVHTSGIIGRNMRSA